MFDDDFFKSIDESHARQRKNIERLKIDICMDIPEVNDHVLVNAGAVGRGHDWVIIEAKVLKVAKTAYFVEFLNRPAIVSPDQCWINPVVITEVLKANTVTSLQENDYTNIPPLS